MADFADLTRIARYGSRNATALAAANFALSGGFGSTASISSVATGSTDMAGQITITSAGTGQGANPTCTLTFADGAFRGLDGTGLAPLALVGRNGGSQLTVNFTWTTTSTTLVLTFPGTPVAAETYTIAWRLSA